MPTREVAISPQTQVPGQRPPGSKRSVRLVSMMALYFLVLVSVGILRPVRNALALDGRAEGDFYQVYLISALVVLFAPIFNFLADRIRWRTLIPATAAFFALNLLAFRAVYSEGDTTFGLVFYGWYDLFAAALVTQFFMAVQIFFNARDAKGAIPLVIASGSMGVVLGGVITGTFSQTVGTPNLLLVAAAFVAVFALALPFLWKGYPPVRRARPGVGGASGAGAVEDFVAVFAHPHIRLIAGLVLITVLVKQIVDYEFNEISKVFAGGEVDAISSLQGYLFAIKDFLPIVVLLPLGPLLRRFGVGFAVLLLPVFMLGSTVALGVTFGMLTAAIAKTGDSMFRYSAERTAREILYVPVPTDLKLKAKAYVDAAIEKGFGKAASGILIGVSAAAMGYRNVTWVGVALAAVWCVMAWRAKRQYVSALAESIRGRFANLDVGFASLTERSTLALVEQALRSDDPVEVSFGLELVEQAGRVDVQHLADELELLLDHPHRDVRARVLRLIARFPGYVGDEFVRRRLVDESEEVGEAAVGALVASRSDEEAAALLAELADSDEQSIRCSAFSWLVRSGAHQGVAGALAAARAEQLLPDAASENGLGSVASRAHAPVRRELALVGGLLGAEPAGAEILEALLADDDEVVSARAIRGVAHSGSPELVARMVSMLEDPVRRGRVKEGLVQAGRAVLEPCALRLGDPFEAVSVRAGLARVFARIPDQRSVEALQGVVFDDGEAFELRLGALRALNKLRETDGEPLDFDREGVLVAMDRALADADRYRRLADALGTGEWSRSPASALLRPAAWEAWHLRRESVFRLLGLVFAPEGMYRAHASLGEADDRTKANALEWLERTLGHALFQRVLPVLDADPGVTSSGDGAPEDVVVRAASDQDPWIASLATHVTGGATPDPEDGRMDVIAKALLLQKVDLLEGARSAHLGLLASIAEEVEARPDEVLVRAGEPNDALYVIVRGSVELSGVGDSTLPAGDGMAFGTWSLIDSAPSVVGARATEHTLLLRMTRSDFQELLSDHPELAAGMLQALARRLRSLVA